ncbi:MAG TPA: divergent polysaccharide deacetylase family protein [Thermoanaerobaculia bacterium]|nr:divergent polysaccharide deacetylase family protein [Thermoanaerobaculia bacterium]
MPETREPLPRVRPKPPRRGRGGEIVLIIDDLGFDGQPLERIMSLDPNVNCSILPNGTRTAEFAETLNARGYEILCHLPMQPRGREAPGRNAILTSMSDEEIARATRENIEAVPHARGMNNHMGSLATSDRRVMKNVLAALPDGMYFIDSRTSGASVAGDVAREMNVRTATRHVFLDDIATESSVRKQLATLAATAEARGVAVGIGHPYPVTMRVLAEELPALRARGFRLVRASDVVR